jgi:TonB family protein
LALWDRSATAVSLLVASFGCATLGTPASPSKKPDPIDAKSVYYAPEEVEETARLVTPIEATYPAELRARAREGEVVARVLVRADGSVAGASLVHATDAAFLDAVRAAILGARFTPALRSGTPVPSWVLVRIRFRLG